MQWDILNDIRTNHVNSTNASTIKRCLSQSAFLRLADASEAGLKFISDLADCSGQVSAILILTQEMGRLRALVWLAAPSVCGREASLATVENLWPSL